MKIEYVGHIAADPEYPEEEPERHLFVAEVSSFADWPAERPPFPSMFFVLFVAADAARDDEELQTFAARTLQQGCVSIVCAGTSGALMEDVFDARIVATNVEEEFDAVIPTLGEDATSVESIEGQLDYFLFTAFAADAYAPNCTTWVALVVGDGARADLVRQLLRTPEDLHNRSIDRWVASMTPEEREEWGIDNGNEGPVEVDFTPAAPGEWPSGTSP